MSDELSLAELRAPHRALPPELWAVVAFMLPGYERRRALNAALTRSRDAECLNAGVEPPAKCYLDAAAGLDWRATVDPAALGLAGAAPPRTLAGLAWARAADCPTAAWLRVCEPAGPKAAFAARAAALARGQRVTVVDALACRWADTPAAAAPLAAAVRVYCSWDGGGVVTGCYEVARQLIGDSKHYYSPDHVVVPGVAMRHLLAVATTSRGVGIRCDGRDLDGARLADYVYVAVTGVGPGADALLKHACRTGDAAAARWLVGRPGADHRTLAFLARYGVARAAGAAIRRFAFDHGPGWWRHITLPHGRNCRCGWCGDIDSAAVAAAVAGDIATLACLPFQAHGRVSSAAIRAGQVAAAALAGFAAGGPARARREAQAARQQIAQMQRDRVDALRAKLK